MGSYFLTNKAVEDLSNIWKYTCDAWSENQADRYFEILIEACRDIATDPSIGKNYGEIAKEIFGFRASKHVIFYRLSNPDEIEVVRILHERMDLTNRLKE